MGELLEFSPQLQLEFLPLENEHKTSALKGLYAQLHDSRHCSGIPLLVMGIPSSSGIPTPQHVNSILSPVPQTNTHLPRSPPLPADPSLSLQLLGRAMPMCPALFPPAPEIWLQPLLKLP